MTIDLRGKTAVITGATGQLGRVMALTLARSGADIAVCYAQNAAMADTLAARVQALGRRAAAFRVDITDEASVCRLRDDVRDALGDPAIVVNNAVIQYAWRSVLDQPLSDFQSQFDACVLQGVHMAKAFLPAMYAAGGGRFIGINTECSALCNAGSGAYASAKRGMDGLYRVLAKEAGPHNVTVNQVAPGWTISDRDREAHTEESPSYAANVPLGRRGTDQDIANAVLFLASDLAGFITGCCLPVSGGAVMV